VGDYAHREGPHQRYAAPTAGFSSTTSACQVLLIADFLVGRHENFEASRLGSRQKFAV
jgi:hypothetical protein